MKNHFVTSDWHLYHENSIKFDQRPFKDVEHMSEMLIKNYNKIVPTNGICYFAGDMGIGNNDSIKKVVEQLNGTKIYILGNHDKGADAMIASGFDAVLYGAVFYIAGQRVTLSHCPLRGLYREPTDHFKNESARGGNWHGENKHDRFTFNDEGQFHLHGHIHSGPATKGIKERILGRQFDVGLPANHYRPVTMSEIESWIMKTIKQGL
jgi:calcineurin-like phosphoesterase family protein